MKPGNETGTQLDKLSAPALTLNLAASLFPAPNAIGPKAAASARWPKTPEMFATALRRIAPQVRMHGLDVTFGRTYHARSVTLQSTDNPCGITAATSLACGF